MTTPDIQRIALIDADILVYESAHRSQSAVEWEPGEFTTQASLPEAQADFSGMIESIAQHTSCDTVLLTLTDSAREANFRRDVWPGYKGAREDVAKHRPLLFGALRQWIRETYTVKQKARIEADDTLGILATEPEIPRMPAPRDRIICSIDKDLDTIPGRHFNWRKPELGVYELTVEEADWNFIYQTLIGDSVDCYPGLKGCGPKTAEKLMAAWCEETVRDPDVSVSDHFWPLVVEAFEKKGFTEEDALAQARCARILRTEDWDWDTVSPILWTPTSKMETSDNG